MSINLIDQSYQQPIGLVYLSKQRPLESHFLIAFTAVSLLGDHFY